jgi:anti-sigma B factor antagonist
MQIDERVSGDVTILDLKGKITLGEGDELLQDKINSLASQRHRKIVLNMQAVSYIDSAGLGELVRAYTKLKRQGGKLNLLHVQGTAKDSRTPYGQLAVTKLNTIFDSYDDEAEAVRSF